MRRWSIRARLTAWFAAVLGAVAAALVGLVWWALADSVRDAVDGSLAGRAAAVERFLSQPGSSQEAEELRDDLREYVALDPGWVLLRIADADRRVLYQSQGFALAPGESGPAPAAPEYRDTVMQRQAVRLLTAPISVRGLPYRVDVAMPTGELDEVLADFRLLAVVLIPVGMLAAALGGYLISGRALAPVDDITSAARSITAERIDRRLDVPATGDELQRLSETLNAMLDRLSAALEDVRRFTADASHELRTPVSVLRTTAEVALRQPRSPAEYQAALKSVLDEAERASRLVEDLLFLARTDAAGDDGAHEPVDFGAVLAALEPRLAEHAAARGLSLSVERPPEPAMVRASRSSLARLIWILADNAVKYTPPAGRVVLDLKPDGQAVALEVRDTGIGIARAELSRVFERFYRTDPARSRDSGGAGLGLAIARSLVDSYGGRIAIDSEPGLGTCARVEFPRA